MVESSSEPSTVNDAHLIWIDLEMTGLDPQHNTIIEIATIVTDSHLNILAEGPVIAIHQPEHILALMDEWNTKQHNASGLVKRIQISSETLQSAERKTIEFLQQYIKPGKSPMCGNSICQDRRFLANWMPELERFFHYRNLDVSTVKELAKRWSPAVFKAHKKDSQHLALQDIRDSIAELEYYRQNFFVLPQA
ncbi:MAG: oligoribonuclease [Pseudomonadota bacterium]